MFDLLGPFTEDLFEVVDHVCVGGLDALGVSEQVESRSLVDSGVRVKRNVAGKRLDGFTDLLGKAIESLHELLLVLRFTATPITTVEAVNERLIDVVHNRVESENGVFVKLTEEDFVVVGTRGSNGLAR